MQATDPQQTRRVALFGGSFNPPHVGHQLAALYVLETQPVDELWFVPVYDHVFGKQLESFEHRVAMCELACGALGPRARVSRAEHELAHQAGFMGSRTLDLIGLIQRTDPAVQLRLVIGTDILAQTASWYRWGDVVAAAPLIVVGRAGHPLPPGSVATNITLPAISSTEIRAELAALTPGQRALFASEQSDGQVGSLLPGSVLRYIAKAKLYLAPP
ncbi:MAG: nicotinate-nicotinamide nucleotide adenylyltransferase [Kofleriaceae bacterium]